MIPKLLIWFKTYQKYLYGLLFISGLFLLVFIKGCSYGKKHVKCPTIVTGTTLKPDTVTHHIYHIWPWYIDGKDSIVYVDVPGIVDTMKILADYYSKHYSTKNWNDSIIDVNVDMMITENKFYPQKFDYHIKRPQTIINNSIDNSVNYARYAYFGVGLPVYPFHSNDSISNINYINLELIYAFPKGYIRGGWSPFSEQFSISAGIPIAKFKK